MPVIRRGEASDLPELAAMQAASPQAAQWKVEDYLTYDLRVAVVRGRVGGFLVSRRLASDEFEILNVVVAPDFRRQGVARTLVEDFLNGDSGRVFLEVRESNLAARNLYKSLGFEEVNLRREYYLSPAEAAIVMKFHSC